MTTAEIQRALEGRGCSVALEAGRFCLRYPDGLGSTLGVHELVSSGQEKAFAEAWRWLHPDATDIEAVRRIAEIVGDDFGVAVDTMRLRDRHQNVVDARHIAMAVARKTTGATLELIADHFSRDHTTVINAVRAVEDRCSTDKAFAARVGTLRAACIAALIAEAMP